MKRAGTCADLSPTEREDRFYAMLAGTAAARVLETAAALGLPALFRGGKALTADEIIAALALDPHRGRKWIALLLHADLLEPAAGARRRSARPRLRPGPLMRALFLPEGTLGYFYRDFLRYFGVVMGFDSVAVLRGAPVPNVPYPPREPIEVEVLEAWMRSTAAETLAAIERAVPMKGVKRLLDVAGGDGTMAVHQARRRAGLRITVFNLPASAALARRNVAAAGLDHRIDVVEGDFLRDPLPRGYDVVRFSRVLADWPQDVCRMLLAKARRALRPGGRVVICEPLADDNPELAFAWHFTYLPYDDFGLALYKPLADYLRMLAALGFGRPRVRRRSRDSIHSVIVARRKS
jgi:SAM-dependent methyltransferase